MSQYPGTIRVLAGINKPPLLVTHEATVLEFRDAFGDLVALFSRHFTDDTWIFVTKDDPDWDSELVRLGYRISTLSAAGLLAQLKG